MKTAATCQTCGKAIPPLPVKHAFCTSCRYDSPGNGRWDAPDEYGNPRPPDADGITEFQYPDDDQGAERARDGFEEKLAAFLAWLTEGCDVKQAGRKALLVAHFCERSGCASDAELARKLKLTPARISQLRRDLSRVLPNRIGECNRRQI